MTITPINYTDLTPELARAGCFVLNMPNSAYHSYEGISKSGLDLIERSPSHYRYREPRSATRAMEIGTAIHAAILEPDRYAAQYMLLVDVHARTASEYKQAIKTHTSECVLVSHEADHIAGMQESVYANESAAKLLDDEGWCEVSAFVECPETGVLLRARFDKLTRYGIGIDLKKTRDARPDKFSRAVYDYRYHVQDAFYSHVYQLITGEPIKAFKIIAVEENMPHSTHVYQLDDEAKAEGARQFERNLADYAEAVNSGHWRGYVVESELLSLPTWVMNQIENEMADAFDAEVE